MKKKCSFLLLPLFVFFQAHSQDEIPVNMYTGTPTIEVPIWNLSQHDISVPIYLSYNANGIKAGEPSETCGLGWHLTAAGSIRRQLKGLPDDFTGTGPDLRKGWLYTTASGGVANQVGNFANTSDLSAATCSDELSDQSTLSAWNDLVDTEPDIFTFDFAGYSGSFVFDNSATPAIHLMPYQDFDLSYTTVSGTDKKITSFTIKTNDGYKYTFGRPVSAKKIATEANLVHDVTFLTREYNQYKQEAVFNTEWRLTRIDSPTGAFADFTYSTLGSDKSSEPVRVGIFRDNTALTTYTPAFYPHTTIRVFTIVQEVDEHWLEKISGSSGEEAEFNEAGGGVVRQVLIKDTRRVPRDELVKEFSLTYQGQLLKTVTESSGCEQKPPYVFDYVGNGQNATGVIDYWGYPTGRKNNDVLDHPYAFAEGDLIPEMYIYPDEAPGERFRLYPIPDYVGTEIKLDGTDRSPNEDGMKLNTLNRITYPSLGSAVIQYEAHRYYDARANTSQLAGGLRIKSITQFDGINPSGRITKEFLYTDPVSAQSSGKLISKPTFILPAWKYRHPDAINDPVKDQYYANLSQNATTAQLWNFLTIRTESDLSDQGETHGSPVGYQFVTVKRTGAGSVRYEFLVPAAYGETSGGQWTAPTNKFARPANCPSMGLINEGSPWGFPFSRHAEIDHERGLILKKSEFNESGAMVRYTENEYQYIFKSGASAHNVWGIRYDGFANSEDNIYFFGKYALPTDYARLPSKETVTTIDASDPAKNTVSSTAYFYESTNHKLLSRVKTTTAEGVEYTRRIKYSRDYGVIPTNAEPALLRLKELQDPALFMHGLPIEEWTSVKEPGSTEKVTGGRLIILDDFADPGKILVKASLALTLAAPLSDFAESAIALDGATYKLSKDPRYEVANTIIAYDNFDRPVSQQGIDRIATTTLWGYNTTASAAAVRNASVGELAFSDLETTTSASFNLTNAYYAAPRTGTNGLHPYATLSKTITRTDDADYLLSFWIKTAAPVTYRVKLRSTDLTTTFYNDTFTHTPEGTDFELIQETIPVAAAPASFVMELTGESLAEPQASSPSLLPSMDDICFIPASAELESYTYAFPYGVASVTSPAGVTGYSEYDLLGRPTIVYDHEKNIRSRNSYSYNQDFHKLDASFSIDLKYEEMLQTTYPGDVVTFTAADNNCFDGVTYAWDMNYDFVPDYVPGNKVATHVFNEVGVYRVSLRVSAPHEEPRTSSQPIRVISRPIGITVCASGALQYTCGQETYHANSCADNPTPPAQGTLFYAQLGESLPGLTYKWKKRYFDAETWTDVGTNSNQYAITSISPAPHAQRGFYIRCEVTDNTGRKGESNLFRIDVYPCE